MSEDPHDFTISIETDDENEIHIPINQVREIVVCQKTDRWLLRFIFVDGNSESFATTDAEQKDCVLNEYNKKLNRFIELAGLQEHEKAITRTSQQIQRDFENQVEAMKKQLENLTNQVESKTNENLANIQSKVERLEQFYSKLDQVFGVEDTINQL